MALVFLGSKTMEWHYKANHLPMPKSPFARLPDYTHIIRKTQAETTSTYRILSHWLLGLTYLMVVLLIGLGVAYKVYGPVQ